MRIESIITNKIDLVDYVSRDTELHRQGNEWRGCCPLHGGSNETSFTIFPNNTYYCFSCGASGNVINYVSQRENLPHQDSIRVLAEQLNINLDSDQEYQKMTEIVSRNEQTVALGHKNVSKLQDYLSNRGLIESTVETFKLGFLDAKMTIPVRNPNGQVVAIACRQFDVKPKYKNSTNNELYDKSSLLFGLYESRKRIRDKVYLVEGYMDVMSGWQMGIACLGYCSAQVHRDQLKTLVPYLQKNTMVIYAPDNDEAGRKNLLQVRERFNKILPFVTVHVLDYPDGCKDMNDVLMKGIDVNTLSSVHIDRAVLEQLLDKASGKEQEADIAEKYIPTIKNLLVKSDCIKMLAKRWGESVKELKEYFSVEIEQADEIEQEFALTADCLADLRRIHKRGVYKTYFNNIDNCIGGISRKQVVVVGAYSSAGKTDFAIEMALKAIINNKMRVAFFSLEMPKGKLMERIVAKVMNVPLWDVERLLEEDNEVAAKIIEKLGKYLVIIDTNNLSMEDIEKRVALINHKNILGGSVDMVLIDYFTYLKGANTYEGASESALRLKGFAKDQDVILVVLSQLNRSANNYDEPTMQNLRMTGDLEASADVILLLWRPDKAPNLSLEEEQKLKNITRMKVEKARDGFYGNTRIEYRYNLSTSRWEEIQNHA